MPVEDREAAAPGDAEESAAHRQHHNVTFALLAVAAVAYALLQSRGAPARPTNPGAYKKKNRPPKQAM
jgi:hypothetical protein